MIIFFIVYCIILCIFYFIFSVHYLFFIDNFCGQFNATKSFIRWAPWAQSANQGTTAAGPAPVSRGWFGYALWDGSWHAGASGALETACPGCAGHRIGIRSGAVPLSGPRAPRATRVRRNACRRCPVRNRRPRRNPAPRHPAARGCSPGPRPGPRNGRRPPR